MFVKLIVLFAILAVTTALVPRFGSRASVRMQSAEPWFPNSVTSNTVSMSTLDSTFASATGAEQEQNFLEAEPYHDMSSIPMNTFKAKEPHIGKIVSVKRIVGA